MANSEAMNLGTEGQILYDANKKSKLVSYLLWLIPALFGIIGGHRFYNRRIKSGLAMLLATFLGFGLYLRGLWPIISQSMTAAQQAAESGQPVDPATLPQPDEAAMMAALQDPLTIAGLVLMAIVTIWWIVDAFLIPGWVRRHNEELAASLRGR